MHRLHPKGNFMQALVVDDSSTMRRLLRSILNAAGFEVAEAGCGAAALDLLEQKPVDLALLDWNMPEMSGIELLGKIRAESQHQGTRIIMVTTESEQSEVERALHEGADEYVMKPFSREAILEKLQIIGLLP
jgi:two-component system chemotaxis response regulator CheY